MVKRGSRGWVQGYRLMVPCLVFPLPVPTSAVWRSNALGAVTIAREALTGGEWKVIEVMLGDESCGGKEFGEAYKEAGGWVLTPKQLPKWDGSWKKALSD